MTLGTVLGGESKLANPAWGRGYNVEQPHAPQPVIREQPGSTPPGCAINQLLLFTRKPLSKFRKGLEALLHSSVSCYKHPEILFSALFILPVLSLSSVLVRMEDNDQFTINIESSIQCPGENCIYFPLISIHIPEIDKPYRWFYSGQPISVSYCYLNELVDPNHPWRIAFLQATLTWNSEDTPITLYFDSQSLNTVQMMNSQYIGPGLTAWHFAAGYMYRVEVFGNYFQDNIYHWSNNQRRSIATHEFGHLQAVGHIPSYYPIIAIMNPSLTIEEFEMYYVPQEPDTGLVNQVYP